jgi:hypothetical protein
MSNMQNSIRIKVELPLEQYNAFIKNMDINNVKIDYNIYDYPVININIPNLPSIHIDIINVKVPLPTNEEITAELCTPEECLSTGRGLFSTDVLDQIVKEDNYISLVSSLSKIMTGVIDNGSYNIHLGLKAFELLMPFLLKQIENDSNSVYYISNVPELKNTKFLIDETINPVLAIVKHKDVEKKLWASKLAKD